MGGFAILLQVFTLVAGFRWAQDLNPDDPGNLLSGTAFFAVVLTVLGVMAGVFDLHWLLLGISYYIAMLIAFWILIQFDGILWFLALAVPLFLFVLLGGPFSIIAMLMK